MCCTKCHRFQRHLVKHLKSDDKVIDLKIIDLPMKFKVHRSRSLLAIGGHATGCTE